MKTDSMAMDCHKADPFCLAAKASVSSTEKSFKISAALKFAASAWLFYSFATMPASLAMGSSRPALPPIPPVSSVPVLPVPVHGTTLLKVMNYNVHGMPFPCSDCSRLGDIGIELRKLRAQGTAPQIVLIQEAFHVAIEDLVREAGYPYRVWGVGPDVGLGLIGSGLLILSEFPLKNTKRYEFERENLVGFDWNSRKGLLYTQAVMPGVPGVVEMITTHMQADEWGAAQAESVAARSREHYEVGRFLRTNLSTQGPAIFGGDFNTYNALPDYPLIAAQTGLMNILDFCKIMGSCDVRGNIEHELSTSVDHQFFRPHTSVNLEPIYFQKTFQPPVNGRRLSDHDAVIVHYRVTW